MTVAKRMMAGVNKEGGAARVTAVTFESDESTLYDVKYVVNSTTEKRLPEALLSVPSAPTPRASSSFSTSSTLPSMEADLRLELENTRRKHKEEVANLEWQLREQRALVQRLRGRQKEASRQLATAAKEAERVRVEREIHLKEVNDRMMMLLEEAEKAAAASEDAVAKVEHAKHSLERRRPQKEKKTAEEELERTRLLCHAEQARVLSNVLKLLEEREEAVEERVRAELGKEVEAAVQREKTTALLVTSLEKQQRDMSLMGMCKKVLPCEALEKLQSTGFNLNALGDSESVDTLHPKRQSVLGNVVNQLLESVLTAAHPRDPHGALGAATRRRDSTKSLVGGAIAAGVVGGEKKQSRSGSCSVRVFWRRRKQRVRASKQRQRSDVFFGCRRGR